MIEDGFFKASEFASKDGKPSPYGPMNVRQELVDFLNQLRLRFGHSLIVTSGYRSPEHNKAVGGVPNSQHVKGLAADIRPQNPAHLTDLWALANDMNETGGVGRYDTFVHVDRRGIRARWDYRSKK